MVYILYDSGDRLYYRQLSGGSAEGLASNIYDPDRFLPDVRLKLDSSHKLHYLRMEQNGISYRLHYNSNATIDSSGKMNQQVTIGDSGSGPFDLAIANTSSGERVYLIHKLAMSSTDSIQYLYFPSNRVDEKISGSLPLDGSGWQISEMKAAGTEMSIYIAFIGRNSSSPGVDIQEIYLSTALQKPTAIAETEFYSKRRLHLVVAGTPPLPVIGWRKAIAGNSTDVYAASPELEHGFLTMKSRQVFTPFEPYVTPHGDALAANSEWVAGLWLYAQSPTIGRIVPWLTGNAYLTSMPFVLK